MIINNQENTLRIYRQKMFLAIIMGVMIVLVLTTRWFEKDPLGITKAQWIIGTAALYILIVAFSWMRRLNYFSLDEKGDKLRFRYYPIRPLGRKRKSVEIPKTALAGYEIRSSMMGWKKLLFLRQHVRGGKVAKYPPIGITALSRKELELLRKTLDLFIRK